LQDDGRRNKRQALDRSICVHVSCSGRKKLDGEWLVALPDTSHVDVDEDMEFIILASDGLWDSLKR
jgi:serine/threonine protein phosphatase PrpC